MSRVLSRLLAVSMAIAIATSPGTLLASGHAMAPSLQAGAPGSSTVKPVAYLPLVVNSNPCPTSSKATFDTIAFSGSPYKENLLTDQNADFRLSILGYASVNQPLRFVSYNGDGGAQGPLLGDMFMPHRSATFVHAYQVYTWNWDKSQPPPYGSRGPLASNWPVTVLDLATTRGEPISVPARGPTIDGYHVAMVLYAGPNELTVVYMNVDQVVILSGNTYVGYVVIMLNFCVDPNLVATYREQLTPDGKRLTMALPAVKNDQPVGVAMGVTMTVAVRDAGMYMDPRDKADWWYDMP